MNQFRKRDDGTLVTDDVFRGTFPDVGFPAVLDADTLAQYGYDPVLHSPSLEAGYGQLVVSDGTVQDGNGNWVYAWKLIDMDVDQRNAMKASDQERVWETIKAQRDLRKSGGLKLNVAGQDYWFWTDDVARGQYAMLDSMVRRKALADDVKLDDWKTMDGTFVPFTVALLHQVIDTGIQNESQLFHTAELHRQAMLLAANPNAYDYSANWGQTYDEYAKAQAAAANNPPP